MQTSCLFLSYQAFISGEGAVAGDQEGSEKGSQEHDARTPNCDCQDASVEFLKAKIIKVCHFTATIPMPKPHNSREISMAVATFLQTATLLSCLEPNDGSLLLPERTLDSQRCASCTIRPAPRTLPGEHNKVFC